MDQEKDRYKVIITKPANNSYTKLLEYFLDKYTADRLIEITNDLIQEAESLNQMPERGTVIKPSLSNHTYRYLVYRRAKNATIKIVYRVDIASKTVYVVDFFPTEMNPDKIDKIVH